MELNDNIRPNTAPGTGWNRKEQPPHETIKVISQILDSIGISVSEISYQENPGFWASSRIEINGLWSIGSNGKGINREYAEASAYAELIERIQGQVLLHNLFPSKHSACEINPMNFDELVTAWKTLYSDYSSEEVKLLYQIADDYPNLLEGKPYYDIQTNRNILLPEEIIKFFAGSNGLAAGNTYEEAFAQGMSEVFERLVFQMIYKKDGFNSFLPTIPRELYTGTYSYDLIKEIESKGYVCKVKDCTMNGRYPVVGVLVMDRSSTKYIFRMGADINFDLALQRTITEIFQGIDFNLGFRFALRSLFETSHGSIWNYADPENGQIPSISNGTGVLPFGVFLDNEFSNLQLSPFLKKQTSNKNAAFQLMKIAKKQNLNLYIQDCGYLGFPTIRIFAPCTSEVYCTNRSEALTMMHTLADFRKSTTIFNNRKAQYSELKKLLQYPPYTCNLMMNKLTGIVYKNSENALLEMAYIYTCLLAIDEKEYDFAIQMIMKHYRDTSGLVNDDMNISLTFVDAIKHGICHDKIQKIFSMLHLSHKANDLMKAYDYFEANNFTLYCQNCENCECIDICGYQMWQSIIFKLYQRESKYRKKQNKLFEDLIDMLINK